MGHCSQLKGGNDNARPLDRAACVFNKRARGKLDQVGSSRNRIGQAEERSLRHSEGYFSVKSLPYKPSILCDNRELSK